MLVLPRIGSPAARSRATTVASYGGTQPSRIRDPQVVGSPRVASTSLTAMGTPSSVLAGDPERSVRVDLQEGVHGTVDLGDPVEVGPGDLDAGRVPCRQRLGDLGGGA